jgi:SAM-dependent methyltransferase
MDRDYELQTHRVEDRHWWYRGRRSVLEGVIAKLRLPARARILDAGCGSGRNMVELSRHGSVTGIELSSTSAQIACTRDTGEVIEGSVLQMPFDADSFDLAASLDVIERPRRDQPPPPPLHASLIAARRRAGRMGTGAHYVFQLAAAAGGDPAACGGSAEPQAD